MPPSNTHQQKDLISQMVSITGVSERIAARYLKSCNFKLNEAVELYFSSESEQKPPSPLETKLDSLFDSLRGESQDEKDKLGLDSTMGYLSNNLSINLEDAELFVAVELIQAPSIGEITRKGYVDGWKLAGVPASHGHHATYIRGLISSLSANTALFKKVYKYAFVAGRERDQKALSLEASTIYWGMLFSAPGMPWRSDSYNWLELWQNFLSKKWTRSVNRDMWNMILEFALKSMVDESLSFWSEDGAWPSVIDDFVAWCREQGIGRSESMEVDKRNE